MRSSTNLKQRRILVVDDDRMNIKILQSILQKEGFEIATADSGEAALETYRSFGPDLALLDVVLPATDGFETCRRLHQTHGEDTAPVSLTAAQPEPAAVGPGLP